MNRSRKGMFCALAVLALTTAVLQVAAAHWDRPQAPTAARPLLPTPFPYSVWADTVSERA